MASVEGSSDSDIFQYTKPTARQFKPRNANNNNTVEALTSTLNDTNRNLRTLDKMLDCYKEYGEQQTTAMGKLREDVARTSERLRSEKSMKSRRDASKSPARSAAPRDHSGRRYPTSPLRDYGYDKAASDNEYEARPFSPGRRKGAGRGGVRFHDDMDADESLHELHLSMRDLASGQLRLEDDIQRNVQRNNRFEYKSTKAMKSIADQIKGSSSVEQRLQSLQAELTAERQLLRQNQHDVGHISSKLSQVDELRRALLRSEDGKVKLREQLDRQQQALREHQRRITEGEQERSGREAEVQRLKEELNSLRHQLHQSAGALGDLGGLRQELTRSEKQRQQLSDHIEVLGKDLEDREREGAKLIHQLKGTSDKLEATERHRQQLEDSLEEAIRKLKEATKHAQNAGVSLRETQQQLSAVEARNAELKSKAQDTVKQWKNKCKRLEKELGVYRASAEQSTGRSEQLLRELESSKHQSTHTAQHVEQLRREFNSLLAIRAQQEEEVRMKDVQVNELRAFKSDLERDLRDCKTVIERLEHELLSTRERATALYEDKNKYEESMRASMQSGVLAQSQLAQLQREVQELSAVRAELSAQLAASTSQGSELRSALKEARRGEQTARDEIEQLLRRIRESGESVRVQALTHAQKRQRAEFEAELAATRLDLQEERTASAGLRRNNDKLQTELEQALQRLNAAEDDLRALEGKYHKVKSEFVSKAEESQDDMSRVRQLELEILDQKEAFRRAVRDNHNTLHTLAAEVDGVVEVATLNSIETYKALSFAKNPSDPASILAEIKSKLGWLKSEIRERWASTRRRQEQHLLADVTNLSTNQRLEPPTREDLDTYDSERRYSHGGYTGGYTGEAYTAGEYTSGLGTASSAETLTRGDSGQYSLGNGDTGGIAGVATTGNNYTGGALRDTADYTGDYTAHYPRHSTVSTYPDNYSTGGGLLTNESNMRSAVPSSAVFDNATRGDRLGDYRGEVRRDRQSDGGYESEGRRMAVSSGTAERYRGSSRLPGMGAYDSDNFTTTPYSTDGELQVEDLTVAPERLSRAQVFQAVERMTSSSGSGDSEPHSDDSALRKTQEERDKINERYAKLQGTLTALRDELTDKPDRQRSSASHDSRSPHRGQSSSPGRRSARRVRISSPPTAEFSPVRRSNPSSRESTPSRRGAASPVRAAESSRHSRDTSERSHARDRSSSSHRCSHHHHRSDSPPRRERERSSSSHRERSHRSGSDERRHGSRSEGRSHRSGSDERRHHSGSTERKHRSPSSTERKHRSGSDERRHRRSDESKHRSPSDERTHQSHRSESSERRRVSERESGAHRSRRDQDSRETPQGRERSPAYRSPLRDPSNPLYLTDEEFNAKFLPKAPANLFYHAEPVM